MGWKVAGVVARLLVGGMFVFAAYGKIQDPAKFAEEVRAYQLAPTITTNAVAIVVPWIEMFSAGLLIVGLWRREARLIIFGLMVAFTIMKIITEVRGLDINCGCWSNDWMEETFHGVRGIVLNLILIGLIGVDYWSERLKRAMGIASESSAT